MNILCKYIYISLYMTLNIVMYIICTIIYHIYGMACIIHNI